MYMWRKLMTSPFQASDAIWQTTAAAGTLHANVCKCMQMYANVCKLGRRRRPFVGVQVKTVGRQ